MKDLMCVYLNVLGIANYLKLARKIPRKSFIPFQIHAPSPIQMKSKTSSLLKNCKNVVTTFNHASLTIL